MGEIYHRERQKLAGHAAAVQQQLTLAVAHKGMQRVGVAACRSVAQPERETAEALLQAFTECL